MATERKGVWERVAVSLCAAKYPTLGQINALLWALENNDIGSIKGLELIKEPYQKDKLWLCVKQYPLLRVPLERIKSVMKKLEKPGII